MVRPEADWYRAFLLRVWIHERGKALLSSVQDVETGETRVFADLDQLSEWLRREVAAPQRQPADPRDGAVSG
jgi:hypothetical protein